MYVQLKDVARNSILILIGLFGASLAFLIFTFSSPLHAISGQLGAQQVTLNPGGGVLANGSDGLRFTVNADAGGSGYDAAIAGQDGVAYRATRQYCCGAGAPMLSIGGVLYGQSGPANSGSVATWSSLQVTSTSGATSVGSRTSAIGNSAATIRYTVVKNGLTYTVDRTMTYTYPNDYVTDAYTFTIPVGNTELVKFYLGGDTAPGSSDQGYGIMLTSPVRSVISLNTSSQIMFGFREMPGSKIFDGATSQHYSAPYSTVSSGGNIGYVVTASNHDAGLMMQWNLGSAPGTQSASLEQFATQQGTNLNASLGSSTTVPGSSVLLNISIVNTVLSSASNLGYTITLPTGLVVGAGTQSNSCGGTMTAAAGASVISLASGAVNSASNCVMSVPVLSSANGTYTISSASISSLSGLTNNVGTSSLVVTDDSDGDGIVNDIESNVPNSGDGNDDGVTDVSQLNVSSLTNQITGEYSTLEVDSSCELSGVNVKRSSDLSGDSGYSYPLGLLDFSADCGTPGFTTTVTQYYYGAADNAFTLRKYINGSYQAVPGATFVQRVIDGRQVLVVTYQVTDGGPLDDDGVQNGIIVDPAGPAIPVSISASTQGSTSVGAPDTGLDGSNTALFIAALILGLSLIAWRFVVSRDTRGDSRIALQVTDRT